MTHQLPPLGYGYSALEPHIDARTMTLHHDMHHAAYVKALNAALDSALPSLRDKPAEWLMVNLASIPESQRQAIRNNAGGHVNHSLLWRSMSPRGGGNPSGPLAEAIDRTFGSIDELRKQFDDAGSKLFGSGWVWLVSTRDTNATLRVLTTSGHDNPLTEGYIPLLVNDVWEHAYYLQHQNRRPEYLKGWWSVVNWEGAAARLRDSQQLVSLAPLLRQPVAAG